MNKLPHGLIAMVIAASVAALFCPSAIAKLIPLTGGGNFSVTAKEQNVTIAGQTVHAMIYEDDNAPLNVATYPDGIPVLVMRLTVGDTVTCKLTNMLPDGEVPEGASIHWHGIELDNDSDGTAVTQDSVKNGQSYTYRFKVTRPGLFWFHSHMVPGNTLFAGMYGVIIVQTPCEKNMVNANQLPADSGGYDNTNATSTLTLALSDIEWATNANFIVSIVTNADMSVTTNFSTIGMVGKANGKQFKTINEWLHACDPSASATRPPCQTANTPGNIVLVNGYNPDTTRGPLTFEVKAGQIIRLRLLNEALTRSFYLKLDPTNSQKLVRIGGQGGLLDNARIEGGSGLMGAGGMGWDSLFDNGAIVVSSGVRFDVVTTIPTNAVVGTTNTLWGIRTGDKSPWPLTSRIAPAQYPVAYFEIVAGAPNNPPAITDGTPILARGGCSNVDKLTGPTNVFLNPFPCEGTGGSTSSVIRLTRDDVTPSIDNLNIRTANVLDGNAGNGDWLTIPPLPTTRYARVGDMLQLSVLNQTGDADTGSALLAHPYHLHGFSLQPLAIVDNATSNTLYTFDYNEFLDTIDVYGGQTLVFNVRLDDRPRMCDSASGPVLKACADNTPGGAVGRWLYHCHIAAHGVLGMIAEIVVLDNDQLTKWLQRPDTTPTGVDVLATSSLGSKTVADDFLCTSNGFISGVHIWGSWLSDVVDPNATFELKFWTDVPAFGGKPSRPGWQIWRGLFPPGTYSNTLEAVVFPNETFYDPSQNQAIGVDTQVHRYDFAIPQCLQFFDSTNTSTRGFYQNSGTIYWLSVTAYTTNGVFGWKSCVPSDHYNDDASWSGTLYGPHWSDLHYPQGHPYYPQSMDMAFALDNAVTIPAGTNSPTLTVVPGPVLSAGLSDDKISITWTGGGILQYADEVTGPWIDIDGAASPYQAPTDAPRRFYRVWMP